MSAPKPIVAMRLHRLEVHASPGLEDFPELRWTVWATGNATSVAVSGYLASGSTAGYGQAQVIALLSEQDFGEVVASDESRDKFRAWARRHVTETMYDTARRALQAQAAQMDFVFTLPLEAPDVDIEIDTELAEVR